MNLLQLLQLLEFIGVVAFALSGVIQGKRKKVDPVGVFVLAFITAFGGGTVRDLLLDRRPFYWVQHESYVLVVFAMTLAAPFVMRITHRHLPLWLFILADAVGLALFSVAGTAMAIEAGLPAFSATMVGVITGVFGGLLRDVFLNEVPMVLNDGKPYATVAFAGNWIYLGLVWLGLGEFSALWIASVATVVIRMLAWRREWRVAY